MSQRRGDPDVRLEDGPVGYLLSAGAVLDVIGARMWDVPPSAVASIVDGDPRAEFKDESDRQSVVVRVADQVAHPFRHAVARIESRGPCDECPKIALQDS